MNPDGLTKPLSEMSRSELEMELFVRLSCLNWHNLSDNPPDPEAVESYGWGQNGGRHTIHILSKYENGLIVLASANDKRPDWKRSGADQFKIDWLWENVTATLTAGANSGLPAH